MSLFRRLLQFVIPYKLQAIMAALLGFLAIGANVGLMASSGYLIASAALRPETILLLWVPIVAVRFFGLSRAMFRYLERLISHDLTFRVLARMRVWLYGRLEPGAPFLLEKHRSGDLLSSVVSDVEQMQNIYLRVLAPPVIACLTAVLGYAILAQYHVTLGLILVAMMAAGGIGLPLMSHRIGHRWGEETVSVRSQLYTETVDVVSGLSELLAFGRMDEALVRMDKAQDRLNDLKTKMNWLSAISGGLMVIVTNSAMWFVLALTIPLVTSHRMSAIAIPTVILVAIASFEAVLPLPLAFQQWGQTMAAGRRLFQFADGGKIPTLAIVGPLREASDVPTCELEVTVNNLAFRYGDHEPDVLQGIDFSLTPGKHMAVVGESGAGKSSILQVLLKLRPYREGRVRLGGVELRDLPDEWVRDQFAVVSQDAYLFNATVADNLRLAKPNATLKELEQAARFAQIHDTIVHMPQKYDTLIGEWGTRLSGGERQRLALARALLRKSPIVLFDEPTNGLDTLTEQAFLTSMQTVLKEKSVLWITHRLSGLDRMDEILVLRNGRLRERGTHQALLAEKGYYCLLWELQKEQVQDLQEIG